MAMQSSEPVSTSLPSPSPSSTSSTGVERVIGPIVAARTWSATWFLVSTLFVGVWWFTLVALLLVVGLGTLILVVGAPVLAAGIGLARAAADSERRRTRAIGLSLPVAARSERLTGHGWARLRAELSHPDTYRGLTFVFLLLVLGPIWFSLTVVAWTVPLSLITTPLMLAVGFEPSASSEAGGWEITIDTMTQAGIVAAVGVLLLPLAPRFVSALAGAHRRIAEGFLSPTDQRIEEAGR